MQVRFIIIIQPLFLLPFAPLSQYNIKSNSLLMMKVTGKDYTFFGKPISLQRQGMLLELLRLWGINISRYSAI